MHFKRRIFSVIALALMVGAMILGIKIEEAGTDEGFAGLSIFNKKETIYFWYADETLSDYLNSAAVAFGAEQNVRVIPVLMDESEYLEAINHYSLHSDRMPDAYLISHDSLEKAYLAGLAGPIEDVRNVCTADNFPQSAISAVTCRDKVVAYPFSFETSALVYNKTYQQLWAQQQAQKDYDSVQEELPEEVLGEAESNEDELTLEERKSMSLEDLTAYYVDRSMPHTVGDLLSISDTFDVPEGVEGIMKWDVSDIFYNYWIVGNYMTVGGDSGDDENRININNQETAQCLEVYKALNQFFFIESDTVTYDSVIQDFIDGKIVFTIATTDVIGKLEAAKAEGRMAYEYGISPMPAVSSELDSRSLSVTTAVCVNGYSEHAKLANEFAAWLVNDYSVNLYERTGKMPAKVSCLRSNDDAWAFLSEYSKSVPLPKMMSTSNYWIELEVLFAKVWNGGDVPALLQELSDKIVLQLQDVAD